MKVCYWGTYDRDYPRNRILISGLRKNGVEVVECHAQIWQDTAEKIDAASSRWSNIQLLTKIFSGYLNIAKHFLTLKNIDFMIVGYSGHFDVFVAKILCKINKVPLIFDAFLSLYDSLVMDRKIVKAGSLKARVLYFVDRYSCKLADFVLLDTNAHIDFFAGKFGAPHNKFRRILIGADDTVFSQKEKQETISNPFTVLHFGKYIPLHGMPYIVKAARKLENDNVYFRLIGSGDEYETTVSLAKELKVQNIEFIDFVQQDQLVKYIDQADICLGIFGDTDKAKRVVPNKVYECFAMAKPVITGDSPAARELLSHGKNCVLCEMENADAMADAILCLKKHSDLRARIARNGYEFYKENCSPPVLGQHVMQLLQNYQSQHVQSKAQICMVGPSYPFRGGISHYTTLLYRALKEKHDVRFFAFKRQYPKWLFPGKTDKDLSNVAIKENGVENILDSLNPWTWLKVARSIRRQNPELVIFPWWTSFWTAPFWTITTLSKVFSNIRVLFLCHNVIEHESNTFRKMCTRWILKNGDFFIVHSGNDKDNLLKMFPYARVRQSFHPIYDMFNYGSFDVQGERRRLGLSGNIVLFFGFIREYKGLEYLFRAMPQVVENISANVLVVGEFWHNKEKYLQLIEELEIKKHVTIIDEYVPNEEVGKYFSAADLVVQPYVSATGSGIIQIAFGFHKPVIATRVGCLPEVVEDGKTGYLISPKSSSEIASAIVKFFQEKKAKEFSENVKRENYRFSWDRMVDVIEELALSANPTRDISPCENLNKPA